VPKRVWNGAGGSAWTEDTEARSVRKWSSEWGSATGPEVVLERVKKGEGDE
jgi:hypothetical protein